MIHTLYYDVWWIKVFIMLLLYNKTIESIVIYESAVTHKRSRPISVSHVMTSVKIRPPHPMQSSLASSSPDKCLLQSPPRDTPIHAQKAAVATHALVPFPACGADISIAYLGKAKRKAHIHAESSGGGSFSSSPTYKLVRLCGWSTL